MTFSADQIRELEAPLHKSKVKEREQAGRKFSYVEAWHAIAEANRIFGYDGWTRETVDLRVLGTPRLTGDKHRVGYSAKVRVTVWAGERVIGREGCGFGSGIDKDVDQAHESALKEAESDAMKRALMTFGNPFGLALYDKAQANVTDAKPTPPGVITGTELLNRQEARSLADNIERVLDADLAGGSGRKSSAQAKRDGDDAKIKADIAKCDKAGLRDWHENFDSYTAELPISWLDSVRDMLESRLADLNGADSIRDQEAELDDGFRHAMGVVRGSDLARNGSERQGAAA